MKDQNYQRKCYWNYKMVNDTKGYTENTTNFKTKFKKMLK